MSDLTQVIDDLDPPGPSPAPPTGARRRRRSTTTTVAPTTPSRTFYALVDQLRGVAALLVVYSHLVTNFLIANATTWPVDDAVRRFVQGPLRAELNFGWYGVAVFFFISGFVVTASAAKDSVRVFAIRRFVRVYLPVVATVALVALATLAGLAVYGVEEVPSLDQVLANATLANYVLIGQPVLVSVGWTLAIEVAFYAMVAVLIPVLRVRPWVVPTVIVAICAGAVWSGSTFHGVPELARLAGLIAFVPLLVLGQVVYLAYQRRIGPRAAGMIGLCAWVVYVAAMEATSPLFSDPGAAFFVNAALALAVFVVVVLLEGRLRPSRVLSVVARRSFSLYLLHVPVGYTIVSALAVDRHVPYPAALVVALVAVALAVELVYRMVERPSVRLGRRLSRPRREQSTSDAKPADR